MTAVPVKNRHRHHPWPDTGRPGSQCLCIFKDSRQTLIVFCAAWCGPYIEKIPTLNKLHQQYDRSELEIVSISLDKKKDDWMKAIAANQYEGLHVAEITDTRNIKDFGVFHIPFSLLVNNNGQVLGGNPSLDALPLLLKNDSTMPALLLMGLKTPGHRYFGHIR